mgnify:CR=1 FL=1
MKLTAKEILERGVEEIIEKKHLKKTLSSKKKLRIKYGIDPTDPRLHLGHGACLLKLKAFQELGHIPILIIGDFTAQIGDASDKPRARKPLSQKEAQENARFYLKEFSKIIDLKKAEVYQNSKWLKKLKLQNFISLASHFTAQQMIQRRNFKERWERGEAIGVHEILYPILQGYDSVMVKADVEIGGFDQLFNLKVGREIQKIFGQTPQDIMTLKMLPGPDGKKMSKSEGNAIFLNDPPEQMYGKIMRIDDSLVLPYFELCTFYPIKKALKMIQEAKEAKINFKEIKSILAQEIVSLFWNKREAQRAREYFERIFKEKKLPEKIPSFELKAGEYSILDILIKSGQIFSKSEAKRLISQGGVKIYLKDGKARVIKDWHEKIKLENEIVARIGKRKFVRFLCQDSYQKRAN